MSPWAWRYSFKGSIAMANFRWVYPHFADCILVYQVETAAAVYQDSREASSSFVRVKGGVQNQGVGAGSVSYTHLTLPTTPYV